MNEQVQLFQIANLIFSTPLNSQMELSGDDIQKIQDRFSSIVKSFENYNTQQRATGLSRKDSVLPYNSMSIVGNITERLVLHFTLSFNKPIMFIIDTQESKVKNYIDMESAKGIIDDDVYQDIKESLNRPRNLNRMFKNVEDINKFVQNYEESLEHHKNVNTITGFDCFEKDLSDD